MIYVTCSPCGGSGISATGDVHSACWFCDGHGTVIARDEKGRFLPAHETSDMSTVEDDILDECCLDCSHGIWD